MVFVRWTNMGLQYTLKSVCYHDANFVVTGALVASSTTSDDKVGMTIDGAAYDAKCGIIRNLCFQYSWISARVPLKCALKGLKTHWRMSSVKFRPLMLVTMNWLYDFLAQNVTHVYVIQTYINKNNCGYHITIPRWLVAVHWSICFSTLVDYLRCGPLVHIIYSISHALKWCHNERDGVSNHQPYDCLLNCLFRRRSKKTSKLRVSGLCEGNSPVTSLIYDIKEVHGN